MSGILEKGSDGMGLRFELAYDRLEEIAQLLFEYTESIIAGNSEVKDCLDQQNYTQEAAHLSEKYGVPKGRIYIAYLDEKAVGCGGIKPLEEDICELKRLFVREEYRGQHIASSMLKQLISDAKEAGYKKMRLDTFAFMESALKMYYKYGFYEIEKYNDNPAPSAIYLELEL